MSGAGLDSTDGAVTYDVEANWGENVAVTPDWRLPLLGPVDLSAFTQALIDPGYVKQYRNEKFRYIPGPQEGTFKTKLYLPGRGTTADNTLSKLATLLSYVIGNASIARAADMTAGADWDDDDGTVSASGGTLAGSVLWFGVLGDGHAEGQPSVLSAHTLTQADMLVALPAAPANGDAIAASEMVYPSETPNDAKQDLTGLRFNLKTANLQICAHGCFAKSISITGTGPNEMLAAEIEWECSWWEEINDTFPDTTQTTQFETLPNACGSFFLAPVDTSGTGARATYLRDYRTLQIDLTLGVQPIQGPGGHSAFQKYVGAKRTPDEMKITWAEDADATTTTPALKTLRQAGVDYHGLIAFTVGDGQRVALRWPSSVFCEEPKQVVQDGLNRAQATICVKTGPTHSSELEMASYVIAQA